MQLIVNDQMKPAVIKKLNKEQNIFNAVTARHSNDICIAVMRRITSTIARFEIELKTDIIFSANRIYLKHKLPVFRLLFLCFSEY